MDLMEEAFKGIESIDYSFVLSDLETHYQCNISKIVENAFIYTVTIPKMAKYGSHFGTCTCGVPKQSGIPCEHMVMMAKAGEIQEEWFTRLSSMQFWLSTAHWRLQFPQMAVCRGDVNVQIIKGNYAPQTDLRYCPSWSGPNESGRPNKKEEKRKSGVMDHIEKARTIKNREKRMFCQICQKFNHVTKDCYKNNRNLNFPLGAVVNNDLLGVDGDDNANDGQVGKV
jgi:hypothetical protein